MADNNQVFGWDDNGYVDIPDSAFTTLEPGEYRATIKTYEKGFYQPKEGAKTPPCPQATVYFDVDGGDAGTSLISNKYCLYSGYPWGAKLKNLFSALGMTDANGNVRINFDAIVGMECRVDVTKDPDKNDPKKFYNHIDKVLPPAAPNDYDNF
jgi:hypothetical protein